MVTFMTRQLVLHREEPHLDMQHAILRLCLNLCCVHVVGLCAATISSDKNFTFSNMFIVDVIHVYLIVSVLNLKLSAITAFKHPILTTECYPFYCTSNAMQCTDRLHDSQFNQYSQGAYLKVDIPGGSGG